MFVDANKNNERSLVKHMNLNLVKLITSMVVIGLLSGCTLDVSNLVGAGLQLACAVLDNIANCPK